MHVALVSLTSYAVLDCMKATGNAQIVTNIY